MDRFNTRELVHAFRAIMQPAYQRLDDAKEELRRRMESRIVETRRRLELASARLEGANPYDILARGYAIVRDRKSGAVLPHSDAARNAAVLRLQMRDGELDARVDEEEEKDG